MMDRFATGAAMVFALSLLVLVWFLAADQQKCPPGWAWALGEHEWICVKVI